MPERVIVTGVVLIIVVALLVFMVEFFLPLSQKSDMDMLCRNTLLRMETAGGLTGQERQRLTDELVGEGFLNVLVTGTGGAKQGDDLNLHVEADWRYGKMVSLFVRSDISQHMTYDRTSMSRRVVN